MTVGTAFHPRTAPLNAGLQWREWSGFFAASAYHASHVIEVNAIREFGLAQQKKENDFLQEFIRMI